MAELPREFVRRAAAGRARSELFRPMGLGFGVDGLAKALAADDANALAVDEPEGKRPVICPQCTFIGPPLAVERHMQRTGHDLTRDVDADDGEAALTKAQAAQRIVATTPAKRHTLVAITPDQFGTDEDSFQKSVWARIQKERYPSLTVGDKLVGQVCELAQWPFGADRSLAKSAAASLPAFSYYVGVLWEPEAWAAYRAGRFSPVDAVVEAFTS
jgi:hypothetical protein